MRLQSVDYYEYLGQPDEWKLTGLLLGRVNLLVGKNATGKSRSLHVVNNLAQEMSGSIKAVMNEGNITALFSDNGDQYEYTLNRSEGKVTCESLKKNGEDLLDRSAGGAGQIWAEELHRMMQFQAPDNKAAIAARRDSIQHPFFEPLARWAESVFYYAFGTTLGQDSIALVTKDPSLEMAFNPKDSANVVGIFLKGMREYGDDYRQAVLEDMRAIGYDLSEVNAITPSNIRVQSKVPLAAVPQVLSIKESGLAKDIGQGEMSQGMFRSLSILVQINYALMSRRPSCILIDDIGEGLDFERSCGLIQVLIQKANDSEVQLVMATNDRFVMNTVPLESWSVLQRRGGNCCVRNYQNSRAEFDSFRVTGLNNFDFFALDYLEEASTVELNRDE